MNDNILKPGQTVNIESFGNATCQVIKLLGSGGQGGVYEADLDGNRVALKWYHPHYLKADETIEERLKAAIEKGAPNDKFLWPESLVRASGVPSFGYLMQLRPPEYKSLFDLMTRKIEPSFRALANAGAQLADSFLRLHSKGLCYCDISFGNVFFNPDTGNILICDNDNVGIDGADQTAILGTPSFMAPEIVRGEALPNTQTDLYSLAVLLFYMFMVHHPLEGKKEAEIKCLDLPARRKLYGTEAVFIYDPNNDSNRPVPGYQDNAIHFWKIYPQFLRDLFTEAFTKGLVNPQQRVRESQWRQAMIRLGDSIILCPHCTCENFYDADALKSNGKLNPCWQCNSKIPLPPRIRINKNVIMLNYNTQLFPHHIDSQKSFNPDPSQAIAEVNQHPTNRNIWGLKNLSTNKWVCTTTNSTIKEIEPGRSVTMAVGTKINFGTDEGEIRV